jgi:hypothetical protein
MGWSPKLITSTTKYFGLGRDSRTERLAFRGLSRSSPADRMADDRALRSRLLDHCWTEVTVSKSREAVALPGQGMSTTCVVVTPDVRTHGIQIPGLETLRSHEVEVPRTSRPGAFTHWRALLDVNQWPSD